jgi:hypothetical protein
MGRETWLRRMLWLAALVNLAGAALFAFPASPPAQLAGFPAQVPAAYRAFCAGFVLLFGGSYAWLAGHRPLVRPMVVVGAVGKAGAFFLMAALWLGGAMPLRSVALLGADLGLAAGFSWGLAGRRGVE